MSDRNGVDVLLLDGEAAQLGNGFQLATLPFARSPRRKCFSIIGNYPLKYFVSTGVDKRAETSGIRNYPLDGPPDMTETVPAST